MEKATDLDIAQAKTMALSLDYYRQLRDKLSHEKAAELVIKCCNPNLSVRQVKKIIQRNQISPGTFSP